jgi:glycosyltransferase involved in cell wall biosynthesis
VSSALDFHLVLADSPVTRQKAKELEPLGVRASFYKHFNVDFFRRNLYRARDRIRSRPFRTLPWYDVIGHERPDLVWFCVSTTNELLDLGYAVEKCRQMSIPYWIVIQHSYESIFFNSDRAMDTAAAAATGASSMIFIAERNRLTLERAIGKRLENVFRSHNTLPQKKIDDAARVAAERPVNLGGPARFFNLGRFSPRDKGQHLLVEAFSDAGWRIRDWTLSFVGMDDFGRSFVERLARYYGIAIDRFQFVPFTDNVFAEIACHDVLVMPSLAEGTPYAMIESMAAGRPAVGTPVGGIPELISEGITGWLARTVDVSDVSDALERMWTDRVRWPQIGRSAQALIAAEYVAEHSAEKLLEKMLKDAGALAPQI